MVMVFASWAASKRLIGIQGRVTLCTNITYVNNSIIVHHDSSKKKKRTKLEKMQIAPFYVYHVRISLPLLFCASRCCGQVK